MTFSRKHDRRCIGVERVRDLQFICLDYCYYIAISKGCASTYPIFESQSRSCSGKLRLNESKECFLEFFEVKPFINHESIREYDVAAFKIQCRARDCVSIRGDCWRPKAQEREDVGEHFETLCDVLGVLLALPTQNDTITPADYIPTV
jgi:hypothetical protein